MNLYEFEGKKLFEKHGMLIPRGFEIRRGENIRARFQDFGVEHVVVKAQILSGKRGKNNGIRFCSTVDEVEKTCVNMFAANVHGQYVVAVRIEEKLDIAEERYLSISYDSNAKEPVLVYSKQGGGDIEDVVSKEIFSFHFSVFKNSWPKEIEKEVGRDIQILAQKLWKCFLEEDCRLVEINPLVKTSDGRFVAADAKVAIDEDAFYRHEEWKAFEPRTMLGRPPTEREIAVKKIDEGDGYYRGTAGKYIEMEGDPTLGGAGIAVLFSGGGASIANMDALKQHGLFPANYTEYSGNPPREKVRALARIVLSKPNLRGLWICGGVANFTDVGETFNGIADALDEVKPRYPIVVRRAGPRDAEGMAMMQACAKRNNLVMQLFGKETSMSETALVLAESVHTFSLQTKKEAIH